MYNTIPNCLQEKKKKEADGAVYLIEPMTLNNHRLGIAINYIYICISIIVNRVEVDQEVASITQEARSSTSSRSRTAAPAAPEEEGGGSSLPYGSKDTK